MSAVRARVVVVGAIFVAVTSAAVRAQDHLAAPQDLRAQTSGDRVLLTWRAGGDHAPDVFRIEAGSGPGLADLAIVNVPWSREQGLDAQFAASGVAAGVYFVRVRAVFDSVPGQPSEELVMRVGQSSCPMPAAPRNVVASVESPIVTLAWEAPETGVQANGYVIEAGSQPGAPNIAIITIVDSTTLSVNAPPGRYFVRLRSMGQCGSSEPSPEVEVIVP